MGVRGSGSAGSGPIMGVRGSGSAGPLREPPWGAGPWQGAVGALLHTAAVTTISTFHSGLASAAWTVARAGV